MNPGQLTYFFLGIIFAINPAGGSVTARAASIAGVTPAAAGTDAFDRNNTFGWRFTPSRDIQVTDLGYFDMSSLAGGNGTGLSQAHDVGIYRVSDQALVMSVTVPAGTAGVLDGHFRYQSLAAPVWLTNGTTYLMAGFALSASPDQACAATNWTVASGVTYANSPTPTPSSPLSGTSQYLVSAHGNPPAVLTYPALAQGQLLPVFAANFKFAEAAIASPQLNSINLQGDAVVLGIANLTVGATNYLEKSRDLRSWEPLGSFVSSTTTTNLMAETVTDSTAVYRIRVAR